MKKSLKKPTPSLSPTKYKVEDPNSNSKTKGKYHAMFDQPAPEKPVTATRKTRKSRADKLKESIAK